MKESLPGFKVIAVFEFLKGAVVLLAGLGALEYLHLNLHHLGNATLRISGFGEEARSALMAVINGIDDQKIILLAAGIVAYAALRFFEAYGLWNERNWARWLAIISGAAYLPYEFYVLFVHFGWIKLGITLFNIAVVIYLFKKHAKPDSILKN